MAKVSVIVPAFNEEKLIVRTLRAIHAALPGFGRAGFATELIVCDNNSSDRTAELARSEGAMVVFEPVNQIARARNCGAAAATGDWLVFVDADSCPSLELFAAAASAMRDGRTIGGGCAIRLDHADWLSGLLVGLWNVLSRAVCWAAGSFIFCEAPAFRALGGFNQALYASEEIDFSRRFKRHARDVGRRMVILHRTPLITSGRKFHLYSRGEHLRLIWKVLRRPFGTLQNRDACHVWYDGRR